MTEQASDDRWQELKTVYSRVWVGALKTLLGWPEQRASEWAQQNATKYFDDADPGTRELFANKGVESPIAALLIRELVEQPVSVSGPERSLINTRLINAMRDPGLWKAIEEYDETDWEAARTRVCSVLKEYGADLPPRHDLVAFDAEPSTSRRGKAFDLSYKLTIHIELEPQPPDPDIYPTQYPDAFSAILEAIRIAQSTGKGSAEVGLFRASVELQKWRSGYLRPPIGKTAVHMRDYSYDIHLEGKSVEHKDINNSTDVE